MSESKVYPELKKDPPSPTSKVIDETKVIKPRAVKQDPWRVVLFDTETCPLVRPVVLKNGRSVPNVNNATIIQDAFASVTGDLIIPNCNLNPDLGNWEDIVGYTEYVEGAWGIGSGELPAEAERLPTFDQSIMAQIYTLRTQVSKRLIIAAHNGNAWDFPIFRRQMLECGYKFPNDMEIMTLDTQYITKECIQRKDPKDRKWNLGYAHKQLFGQDIVDQHTAAGDVKALSRIICLWASHYCPKNPTEADITNAVMQHARGMSRIELLGVSHPLPELKRIQGPRQLRLSPQNSSESESDSKIQHQITTTTTTTEKRSLLTTLEKL